MNKRVAKKTVARGAAFLDAINPGWFTRIDVGTLQLESGCRCVLAQTYGKDYSSAAHQIGVVTDWSSKSKKSALALGFHCAGSEHDMRRLQDAWIDAIARRMLPRRSVASAPQSVAAVDPVVTS